MDTLPLMQTAVILKEETNKNVLVLLTNLPYHLFIIQ